MDFTLQFPDRDIKILQITDMQVIDSSQQRYPDRLRQEEYEKWMPETKEKNLYCYIRELVSRTAPDLIIITGDITYGEFDDSGKSLEEFIDFMDSFGIPWAPVYGNHDNETYIGVEKQNAMYENSKHGIFKKGNVFGNGNYSIAIKQGEKVIRTICMMDSNGCGKLGIAQGFREDQLEWLKETSNECDVPLFCCFHIPTKDFSDAYVAAGYQEKSDERDTCAYYELGVDMAAKAGDFGKKYEDFYSYSAPILSAFKASRVDGVFAGHYHKINLSVVHEGIRFTMGLKTGLYDYHDKDAMGGTLITLCGKDFSVHHEYCRIAD